MSIENQLIKFSKTDRFKKLVSEKFKTDEKFASSVGENAAQDIGKRMSDILHEKLENIRNQSGKSFLDSISVEYNFVPGTGLTVDIKFDPDEMHRDSLYPEKYKEGVQINILFNEGYEAQNYVYGTDRHGNDIRSRLQRDGLFFIQEAVELFNAELKGKAIAEYSSKYTGGTL